MRVCHLTSVHSPFDGRIFFKECRTLAAGGHRVTIVASHDRDTVRDGINIKAVPRSRTRWSRMFLSTWRIGREAFGQNARVYHFHDPELIPLGLVLKAARRKVIYDVHEDVATDVAAKEYLPRPLRRQVAWIVGKLEVASARVFDQVVAATPKIAARFESRKTATVQNFPLFSERETDWGPPLRSRAPEIVYFGGITRVRGIEALVQALALLPHELGARLVVAGKFDPPSLEKEVMSLEGADRIEFVGWLDYQAIASLLRRARVGVVTYHPTPSHLYAQPTKLFDYMGAGLPVVASDFPLWRTFIVKERCGLLVDPGDPESIAKALVFLLTHPEEAEEMGQRGRRAVARELSWEHEARKLLNIYRSLGSAEGTD